MMLLAIAAYSSASQSYGTADADARMHVADGLVIAGLLACAAGAFGVAYAYVMRAIGERLGRATVVMVSCLALALSGFACMFVGPYIGPMIGSFILVVAMIAAFVSAIVVVVSPSQLPDQVRL